MNLGDPDGQRALPPLTVAILVSSDRASSGAYEDRTAPALKSFLSERGWRVVEVQLVPDERDLIARTLRSWADGGVADLLLTAGGTGLGPRDVTPEATRDVLEREVPGLPEVMRARGAERSPRAPLSRGVAGTCSGSLLLNLPGSPAGAVESLGCVLDLLPHAVEMLRGGGHGEGRGPRGTP